MVNNDINLEIEEHLDEVLVAWKSASNNREENYAAFHNIPEEKQERILHAAFEEFAENDYGNASTNNIVKKAGISKGLLFRYFKDKVGLALYLALHTEDKMSRDPELKAAIVEGDMLDIVTNATIAKLNISALYPLETHFYVRLYQSETPPEIQDFLKSRVGDRYTIVRQLGETINEEQLLPGFPKELVLEVITWVIERLSDDLIKASPDMPTDFPSMAARVELYMNLLRKAFFKEKGDTK